MGTPGPLDPSGLSGRTISHFRVLEPLGAGGMGVVYRAEDVRLQRTVALKFMRPGFVLDDEATARFLREARSVAVLDHPNICTIHEVGEDDGQLFLAMSYYGGETLKERLTRRGRVPVAEALDMAVQIMRGLACAHDAGIIHRDLKPANVMLTPGGTVKILDFGLAKSRDQTMTASGVAMGTVAYMSPEQLLGERVDARSDLWSFGVVLFEMLTGEHPSRGDDTAGRLERQIDAGQITPVRPDVTAAVREVVDRLLRRNPEERYQKADDVLADLTALRQRVATATAAAPSATGQRSSNARGKRIALGSAVVALAVAGVLGGAWWARASRQDDGRAAAAVRNAPLSLAVLPLKNYSNPDQEYFADGMTEELTSTLTKIEGLRVIAHQSVAQFKRSDRPVPEIARALDVTHVVDGSIRQEEGRVRITASLIDATRNAPVWSNSFDRDRRDVMALQRDVAVAVAQAIRVTLTPEDRTRLAPTRPVDPDAFALYLRGSRARYDANFSGDFTDATRYLEGAIAKDSGLAPAYAGLAAIYVFTGDEPRARYFADKALAIDPTLAEGHVAQGMIRQFYDWDLPASESAYREAMKQSHSNAEAHHELGMLLMRLRRFDEALGEVQYAAGVAPTSARFLNGVGEVSAFGGRLTDALAIADSVLAMDSTFSGGYYIRGMVLEQKHLTDAEPEWRKCIRVAPRGCGFARARLGYIYALTNRRPQAIRVLDSLRTEYEKAASRDKAEKAQGIALVHVGLGQNATALDWLERSFDRHGLVLYTAIDPAFRPLANEPRFRALLKRAGLPS